MHINEVVVKQLEKYGFPPALVRSQVAVAELNHLTVSYHLLM